MKLPFGLMRKKDVIKTFAGMLAQTQKKADQWFYIRHDQNHSSWLLDQVLMLKQIAELLGIAKEVYEEAYKIYDFRNSGKKGYEPDLTLLSKD